MKNYTSFIFILASFVLFGSCFKRESTTEANPHAPVRIIYVQAGASEEGADGTSEKPYSTINAGIEGAKDQDIEVIRVLQGEYPEGIHISDIGGLDSLTIEGENIELVKLTETNQTGPLVSFSGDAGYVTIKNIWIYPDSGFTRNELMSIDSSGNISLDYVRFGFTDASEDPVGSYSAISILASGDREVRIRNCEFYYFKSGIKLFPATVQVEDSVFYMPKYAAMSYSGIRLETGNDHSSNTLLVKNNTFYYPDPGLTTTISGINATSLTLGTLNIYGNTFSGYKGIGNSFYGLYISATQNGDINVTAAEGTGNRFYSLGKALSFFSTSGININISNNDFGDGTTSNCNDENIVLNAGSETVNLTVDSNSFSYGGYVNASMTHTESANINVKNLDSGTTTISNNTFDQTRSYTTSGTEDVGAIYVSQKYGTVDIYNNSISNTNNDGSGCLVNTSKCAGIFVQQFQGIVSIKDTNVSNMNAGHGIYVYGYTDNSADGNVSLDVDGGLIDGITGDAKTGISVDYQISTFDGQFSQVLIQNFGDASVTGQEGIKNLNTGNHYGIRVMGNCSTSNCKIRNCSIGDGTSWANNISLNKGNSLSTWSVENNRTKSSQGTVSITASNATVNVTGNVFPGIALGSASGWFNCTGNTLSACTGATGTACTAQGCI